MLAILTRELRGYFQSPFGYIFLGFFLLLTGFFVATSNIIPGNPNYTGTLGNITFVFLIVVPIHTMRLFTEERRQHTDQLLLTTPLKLPEIVMGKYLASLAVFIMALLVTALYPVGLSFFGSLSGWEILGAYIGFLLLGACFIAVGTFVSSLTENQVIAAVITFVALLLMWIIDIVQSAVPAGKPAGIVFAACLAAGLGALVFFSTRNLLITGLTGLIGAALIVVIALLSPPFFDTFIIEFLRWFSLLERFGPFTRGILSLSPVVYYLSFCAVFLYLTVRVIDKKRWS